MRIKLLKPVSIKGNPEAQVGVPFEPKFPGEARQLIGMGLAELVSDSPTEQPEVTQTREPSIEVRDPAPLEGKQTKKPSGHSRAK